MGLGFENIFESVARISAIRFNGWIVDNNWVHVYSPQTKESFFVKKFELNATGIGSDHYIEILIKSSGKTINELYDLFVIEERKNMYVEAVIKK